MTPCNCNTKKKADDLKRAALCTERLMNTQGANALYIVNDPGNKDPACLADSTVADSGGGGDGQAHGSRS